MGPWWGFVGTEVTTRGFSDVSSRAQGHTARAGPGALGDVLPACSDRMPPAPGGTGHVQLALLPGVPQGLPFPAPALGALLGATSQNSSGRSDWTAAAHCPQRPAGKRLRPCGPAGAPAATPPGPRPAPVERPRLPALGVARVTLRLRPHAALAAATAPGVPPHTPGPTAVGLPQVQLWLAGQVLRRVRPVPGLRARQLRGALAVQLRGQLGRPAVQQR